MRERKRVPWERMCQEKVGKRKNWTIKGGISGTREKRKTSKVVYVRIEGVGRNSTRTIRGRG